MNVIAALGEIAHQLEADFSGFGVGIEGQRSGRARKLGAVVKAPRFFGRRQRHRLRLGRGAEKQDGQQGRRPFPTTGGYNPQTSLGDYRHERVLRSSRISFGRKVGLFLLTGENKGKTLPLV